MKKFFQFALIISVMLLSSACQVKGPKTASGLNRVHFDFDSYSLRSDMIRIMDANAAYLKKNSSLKITVEGHCDERGTNEYNLALGDRRATAAASYLVNKGISESRLNTVSYGEEKPMDKGHNESAWYNNRRAEFVRQ